MTTRGSVSHSEMAVGSRANAPHAGASHVSRVRIAPTLAGMQSLYQLARDGGVKSDRFTSYLEHAPTDFGFAAYNPMAGVAALESVQQLMACDAEGVALATAQQVAALCDYDDELTLAVAVRSAGMWTHRIATEVDERAAGKMSPRGHGIVSLWSREECSVPDVARETAAETVRVMWSAIHGAADTVQRLLQREGLAYAIASQFSTSSPYDGDLSQEETVAVLDALQILGESRASSDMAGVLFGDSVAVTMGWSPPGVPHNAGYKWAIARATHDLVGSAAATLLRADVIA